MPEPLNGARWTHGFRAMSPKLTISSPSPTSVGASPPPALVGPAASPALAPFGIGPAGGADVGSRSAARFRSPTIGARRPPASMTANATTPRRRA
jgi:hypothetical protein